MSGESQSDVFLIAIKLKYAYSDKNGTNLSIVRLAVLGLDVVAGHAFDLGGGRRDHVAELLFRRKRVPRIRQRLPVTPEGEYART